MELSQATKEKVTTACVDFCAEDLRLFDTVADQGLHHLIDVVSFFDVIYSFSCM